MDGAYPCYLVVWVQSTCPVCYIRSLTNIVWMVGVVIVNHKRWWDDELLRIVYSKRWKPSIVVHSESCLIMEKWFVTRSGCPFTPYVLYSLILCPVLEVFPAHRRNYRPLVERTCLLICLNLIFLSPWLLFYHTAISLLSCFRFIFCLILLAITFLFGLIVLHRFIVLVLKSSNNWRCVGPCTIFQSLP